MTAREAHWQGRKRQGPVTGSCSTLFVRDCRAASETGGGLLTFPHAPRPPTRLPTPHQASEANGIPAGVQRTMFGSHGARLAASELPATGDHMPRELNAPYDPKDPSPADIQRSAPGGRPGGVASASKESRL